MITWTKQKNGHVLTIKFDDEATLKNLEDMARDFEMAIKEGKDCSILSVSDFYQSEFSNHLNCLSLNECLADIKDMIDCVCKMCTSISADTIFNMAQYKKNGTFKRSAKPIIHIVHKVKLKSGCCNGNSFGSKTYCFRINPIDDFTAEIEYARIAEHC